MNIAIHHEMLNLQNANNNKTTHLQTNVMFTSLLHVLVYYIKLYLNAICHLGVSFKSRRHKYHAGQSTVWIWNWTLCFDSLMIC